MLRYISDLLTYIQWFLVAVSASAMLIKAFAVNGTPRRYIAKSVLIVTHVLLGLVWDTAFVVGMYLDGADPLSRVAYTIGAAIFTGISITWIYALLNEDDDDWFNDQWKKMKRWVKNLRSASRRKLAPVSTH